MQAVIKILPERPFSTNSTSGRLLAAISRTSADSSLVPPSVESSPLPPRSALWPASGPRAGQSRRERACPIRRFKEADPRAIRIGECPALVPEQFRLARFSGRAAQLIVTNGRSARGPCRCSQRARRLLPVRSPPRSEPGAGFAPAAAPSRESRRAGRESGPDLPEKELVRAPAACSLARYSSRRAAPRSVGNARKPEEAPPAQMASPDSRLHRDASPPRFFHPPKPVMTTTQCSRKTLLPQQLQRLAVRQVQIDQGKVKTQIAQARRASSRVITS